jgi:hypothetical protein
MIDLMGLSKKLFSLNEKQTIQPLVESTTIHPNILMGELFDKYAKNGVLRVELCELDSFGVE